MTLTYLLKGLFLLFAPILGWAAYHLLTLNQGFGGYGWFKKKKPPKDTTPDKDRDSK